MVIRLVIDGWSSKEPRRNADNLPMPFLFPQVFVRPLVHDGDSFAPTVGKIGLVQSPDNLTSMAVFFHSVEQVGSLDRNTKGSG